MFRFPALCGFALLALMPSCGKTPPGVPSPSPSALASTNRQVFQVKGVIIELKPEEKTVKIKHEEIPGYMAAMTMPFEVKDTNELNGLEPGDTVSFWMVVTDTDGWIERVRKLGAPPQTNLPTTGPFRLVREVEPLNAGDLLPEYHFTNQFGLAVSTRQFRGRALAITFIYTRCPYPTFCPRTTSNFEEAQKKLLSQPNAPTNWHLLTLSFDPEWDTPARLQAYAERYHYQPDHWSFATGELIDVTAIAEQCGLLFWHETEGAGISHNLRTVVVNTQGRIQRIIPENKWTSDELVAEMIKAAQE